MIEINEGKATHGQFYEEMIEVLQKYRGQIGNQKLEKINKSIEDLIKIFEKEKKEFLKK